jgi:hypothetical protein
METNVQSAQKDCSELEPEQTSTFVPLRRSPITVQTYESHATRGIMRSHRDKRLDTYRPNLPIISVDRETLERMR